MAMERYFQETGVAWDDSDEDEISLNKWESVADTVDESENNPSGGFDCNICLDIVQDPVVTLCGHLYCWPCIYKWMQFRSVSAENPDHQQPQCPVCKAEVSQRTLIPLYGQGRTVKSSEGKGSHLGIVVPQRPGSPHVIHTPVTNAIAHSSDPAQPFRRHRRHPQQPPSYHPHPTLGLAGMTTAEMSTEMVYARIFGSWDRVRRQIIQAESVNRIIFFLFCFAVLCLLLF